MYFKKPVVRVLVKIDGDVLLKGSLQLFFQVINKRCYPAVVLIVFLAVADEDVVFVSGDYAGHD